MKRQNGITLIALVITIIIILILVAVTISSIIGGGIIDQAGNATIATQNAISYEKTLGNAEWEIGGKKYDSVDDYVKGEEKESNNEIPLIPGLYETGAIEIYKTQGKEGIKDMLIISWDMLLTSETFYVNDNAISHPQHILAAPASFAIESEEMVSSISYNHSDSCGLAGDLILPEDGTVTTIDNDAFSSCDYLTGIYLPDCITNIGSSAFTGCLNLNNFTIPIGITNIEYGTFAICNAFTSIGPVGSGSSLEIPDSVISLGYYAFYNCFNLNHIIFPSNVKEIDGSFASCPALTNVTIPGTIETIGPQSFENCKNLTNITISDGVKNIGEYAFSYCDGLTNVHIPNSVTLVEKASFYGMQNLTNLTVASGNKVYHTAGNCLIETKNKILIEGFNNSIIPTDDTVTIIGPSAFGICKQITSITIPEGVTNIDASAFCYCDSMTSITIPNSVTNLGTYAFSGCTKLKDIYFDGTKAEWNNINKGNYWNKNMTNYSIHCTDGVI